ncbi:alpha/beta hydrolase [Nakamurella antarctica]|uniref:Alpha/beta hydrolase n=1 Tax=Nakamurella antarctica TaxID=1902245 RepID=A0A3G8ZNP9_9ACTN|nr:prolyl oligopeptidase family serine peptidase [Nakamurella antarctica]AZI58415.1 alpha/beta hydrolase [Nakamurella antarctica]
MTKVHEYSYGSHPDQHVKLHIPTGDRLPVVLVIHGGFWRSKYGVELAEPLAADLAGMGIAAAAVEYRRVGGASGGGWPRTLADVSRAVDALATSGQYLADGRLDLSKVVAIGHSAGGHLAAWLAHRPSLRFGTAGSIGPSSNWVPLRGAVSQAGVLDLAAAVAENLGNGAIIDMMNGQPGSVPQQYHHASPMSHVGDGAQIVCVHGDLDDEVPISQSQLYVEAAILAGDPARFVPLPGVGHYELIDPEDAAWTVCRDAAVAML